jgi:hypothetical protein
VYTVEVVSRMIAYTDATHVEERGSTPAMRLKYDMVFLILSTTVIFPRCKVAGA